MIGFHCPACRHYGESDNALAGEIIGCANCATHFRLPRNEEPVQEVPQDNRPSIQEPGKGAVVEAWARCRRCGARRTAHDRCTFCGFAFLAIEPVESPETRRARRQVGLQVRGVIAIGLAVIGLAAGAYYLKVSHDDGLRICQENLMIFHQAIKAAEEKPEGVPKSVGRAFLVAIAVKEHVSHALLCPAVNRRLTYRPIDFRGPVRPWDDLGSQDPVIADLEGNHRGVTVLLKNGQVEYASRGSVLYRRALEETKP